MPTESVSNRSDVNPYFVDYWKVRNWISSDRAPNGELSLRSNPYTYLSGQYGARRYPPGYHSHLPATPPSAGDVPLAVHQQYALSRLESRCYEKFRGKLYRGSAALGVTFGSMAQSRAMVAQRCNTLRRMGADVVRDIELFSRKRGVSSTRLAEYAAGVHLEIIFGWTPLVADIWSSTNSVIQLADQHNFLSVAANGTGQVSGTPRSYATRSRVAYTSTVRIDNPNKWLAERAGLLNPASVVWDLVPWSFVINMFVNTGQLVQQVTDFAGLRFDSISCTKTMQYYCQHVSKPYPGTTVSAVWKGYDKRREAAKFPAPPGVQLRIPNADWGTAAMAASLFIQQFGRVTKVLTPLLPKGMQQRARDAIYGKRRRKRGR